VSARPRKDWWTYEKCLATCNGFKTHFEWSSNNLGAYGAAFRHKWLSQLKVDAGFVYNQKWTYEKCLESCRPFKTFAEWRAHEPNANQAADYHGWISRLKIESGLLRGPSSTLFCVYLLVRDNGDFYVGITRNLKIRLCSHRRRFGGFTALVLADNLTPNLACAYEEKLVEVLKPALNRRIGGSSVGPFVCKYTLADCRRSARKFKTRSAWILGDNRLYRVARYHGWIDLCCGHMEVKRQERTFDKCLASRKQYSTRGEWKRGDPKSYGYANVYGWLSRAHQLAEA
jgi:hypothetical protein